MDTPMTNPIDLSADAFLELEELRQRQRTDAPAFLALCQYMQTPSPTFQGRESISMLADARSFPVLRDSMGSSRKDFRTLAEFRDVISNYLSDLKIGVETKNNSKIDEAKRFALALNESMISKEMNKIYQRRERSDLRYVKNELVS
jgi:hypothetical protein